MVNQVQEPQEWGVLHDVMLIYLAFIHGSNAIQASSIQRAALQRVMLWLPDIDALMLERVLNEALLVFVSTSGPQMLNATVPSLAWLLPEQQRAAILIDLAEMACALRHVGRILGVPRVRSKRSSPAACPFLLGALSDIPHTASRVKGVYL